MYSINTTKEKTVTQKKVAENRPMPYLLDSGSMINIVKDKSAFQDYKDHQIVITRVSGQKPVSEGKGKMIFHGTKLECYYVPNMQDNILCMSELQENGFGFMSFGMSLLMISKSLESEEGLQSAFIRPGEKFKKAGPVVARHVTKLYYATNSQAIETTKVVKLPDSEAMIVDQGDFGVYFVEV